MTEHPRLARQTSVEACQALLEIGPRMIPESADVLDVVGDAARQSRTRPTGDLDLLELALVYVRAVGDRSKKDPSVTGLSSGPGS